MKKYLISVSVLFIMITGCTVKDPVKTLDNEAPSLSDLKFIQYIYVFQDTLYPVSVKVRDQQGRDDIVDVSGYIQGLWASSETQYEFKDDGASGDIIPNDGIYYLNLRLDDFKAGAGTYLLTIEARDLADLVSETLTDTIFVMAGEPPYILNVQMSDSLSEADLSAVTFNMDIKDSEGLDDIDSVYINLYYPWQETSFHQLVLHAGSPLGDSLTIQDSYVFQEDLSNILKIPTEYTFEFIAVDVNGLQSMGVQKSVSVNRPNDAPVLSDLVAPDQITLPSEGDVEILLTVKASDLQGDADIEMVWFDTVKPDGNPSSGNPFEMYDNGFEGDVTPGDGVYSLRIYLISSNDAGTYTFNFQARDRSGAVSNVISHELTVVE